MGCPTSVFQYGVLLIWCLVLGLGFFVGFFFFFFLFSPVLEQPCSLPSLWLEEWNRAILHLFGGCYAQSPSHLFLCIIQWGAETWPAATHLLSVSDPLCWLSLYNLSWPFRGEKLSNWNRCQYLEKGLSSIRFPSGQMTEAGHLFNLALGTAKIQQTSYKLLEPVARSWTKIQPCHLCINVLWIHPAFKMQVTGIKRSSRGIAVPVSSSAYCFVIKGLCAQTTWVQRAREAKPRKHRFRLSIINGKVWPSLTHLEGAEERLVTEFDTALMKRVTFLNAQRVLAEPASAALVCTGPLVPCHAAGWDLRRWGILWTGSPCLASPMVPSPNRRALAFGRELTGLPWAASFQTVLFWSFKVNDGWASRVDFEGSEKCNRVASISHLIFLTQEGKMKNMRHLPLNLQDFCLMWFIISISDVSGIKTWKHGPRRRVLDWPCVGGG